MSKYITLNRNIWYCEDTCIIEFHTNNLTSMKSIEDLNIYLSCHIPLMRKQNVALFKVLLSILGQRYTSLLLVFYSGTLLYFVFKANYTHKSHKE